MANDKNKLPKYTSPKGVFRFPRLNEPDHKFKAEGEYSVKLVLPADDAETFIAKLQPHFDEAVREGEAQWGQLPPATKKKNPFKTVDFYTPIYDADENETGEIEFKFSMKASGKNQKTGKPWTRKPAVFDAKGKPLVKLPEIWGGTIGKVSFEVLPFFTAGVGAGLSLRLQAVQIIELRQGGQRSATDYGFGEEDGYEHEEPRDEHGFDDESTEQDDSSSDDADF